MIDYTNGCLGSQVNLPRILDLQPPRELLTRCEQRRWHREVRTITTTSRWLDSDVVIAADVAVADPDPDIRRDLPVPHDLNRRPGLPRQACMIDRPAPQKHLATFPSLRPRHVTSHLDVHIGLIAKQGMRAPIGVERRVAQIRVA